MNEPTMPRVSVRIAMAVLFAAALGLLYWYFVTTEVGQRADAATLGATEWYRIKLAGAEFTIRRYLPLVAVALAAAALIAAALRRRWRDVVWAAAFPVVGYGLAGVLRNYVFSRPELGDFAYPVNTLPTGRVVATIACLVVAIWLAPRRWWPSPMIAFAAVVAGGVGTVQVITFAHRYSDVVASALLVGALAAVWPMARRAIPVLSLVFWVVVGVAAAVAGTALVLRWDSSEYDPSTQVPACLGIAAAMTGAAALALVAGTVMPRRSLTADTSE